MGASSLPGKSWSHCFPGLQGEERVWVSRVGQEAVQLVSLRAAKVSVTVPADVTLRVGGSATRPGGGAARQGSKVSERRCPSPQQRHRGKRAVSCQASRGAGDRPCCPQPRPGKLSGRRFRNVEPEGVRAASFISRQWAMFVVHQRPSQTPGRPPPSDPSTPGSFCACPCFQKGLDCVSFHFALK